MKADLVTQTTSPDLVSQDPGTYLLQSQLHPHGSRHGPQQLYTITYGSKTAAPAPALSASYPTIQTEKGGFSGHSRRTETTSPRAESAVCVSSPLPTLIVRGSVADPVPVVERTEEADKVNPRGSTVGLE